MSNVQASKKVTPSVSDKHTTAKRRKRREIILKTDLNFEQLIFLAGSTVQPKKNSKKKRA